MAYIGNVPTTANFPLDFFHGDATTTLFVLSQSPGSASAIDVHIGSVYQVPGSAYTVSGTSLIFTSAPPSGTSNIVVVHKGVQVEVPNDGQYLGNASIKAIAYNSQQIAEDITVAADQNALSAGPITINDGSTVTVITGARWVIV